MDGQPAVWGVKLEGQVKQLAQSLTHHLRLPDAFASTAWYLGLGKLEAQRQCQQMSWIK